MSARTSEWEQKAIEACTGMTDPAESIDILKVESWAYAEASNQLHSAGVHTGGLVDSVKVVVQQRDELATALRAVLSIADRKHDAFDAAHAALAKVTP